jgi:hypothetical protein
VAFDAAQPLKSLKDTPLLKPENNPNHGQLPRKREHTVIGTMCEGIVYYPKLLHTLFLAVSHFFHHFYICFS